MLRVVVADDCSTARALLVGILRSDPEVQVVGEARDGVEAVALTQKLRPDVVTMDVLMPRMDGFAATKEIMITAPTPIVIITAGTAGRDVEVALHALRTGALCVLPKPPGLMSPAFEEVAQKLLASVKSMAQVKVVRHWRPARQPEPESRRALRASLRGSLVAIATSTGGPAALQHLLGQLSGDFPAPILVVQHITPGFMPGLAAWLNTGCNLRVKLAEHGEPLAPRTVYLAPDDQHLGVSGLGTAVLSGTPPIGGFRPSGTFLFESVAKAFGPSAIALILTGMGEDGVPGLRAVRQGGGRILAQDQKSSVVFGMPGAAVAAGLADVVLSLDGIASRLGKLV